MPVSVAQSRSTRVAPAVLASLLLGRGMFRLAQYGAALALLAVWGEQRYGLFAAALGAFLWLTAVTSVGTEKAALKLLARARRTHSAILGAFVFIACVVQVPPLILFGVAVVSGWSEPAALYAGGAALAASLGANGLLVGLLRVTGRPRGDVVNFVLLAAVYVVLTAVAGTGAIGPVSYLGLQLVVVTVMNVVLVRRLGRPGLVIGERPVLVRLVGRTVGLMGGTELVAHAAPSILFVELAMTRWSGQSGWLYLTDLVWSAALNLFFYLLRVYQPHTATRFAGPGARSGRASALRLARLAMGWSVAWLSCTVIALATRDLESVSAGLPLVAMLAVVLAVRAPGFALVNLSGYLLENTDARSLRTSAVASVCGLTALTLAGLIAIPSAGALGAVTALGIMDLTQATVLFGLARRR